MSKSTRKIVAASFVSIFAVAACADDGKSGRGHHDHMKVEFSEIDVNGDGQVTMAEMKAHLAARFAQMDANSDGEISAEEFTAIREGADQRRVQKWLERHDTDGSGGVSLAEMQSHFDAGRAAKMMEYVDSDGDGQISEAEFEAMKDRRGNRRHYHDKDNAGQSSSDAI